MKPTLYFFLLTIIFSCSKTKEYNSEEYFEHINNADLAICDENYVKAISEYELAFSEIEKPFGKDVFNSALSSQLNKRLRKKRSLTTTNNKQLE